MGRRERSLLGTRGGGFRYVEYMLNENEMVYDMLFAALVVSLLGSMGLRVIRCTLVDVLAGSRPGREHGGVRCHSRRGNNS